MAKYKFSKRSLDKLNTCDKQLRRLMNEVIKEFDCTILCGHRNKKKQNKAVADGNSKVQWPDSKHNKKPSRAVDAVPYPVEWKNTDRMYFFSGYVKGVADRLGIEIRQGMDWDSDTKVHDQTFIDLPHIELKEK